MLLPPNDRDVFRLNVTVSKADIDELDHVNNVVYVSWVQDVAAQHWKSAASMELRNQCRWVVLRHEIDYLVSAVQGESLEVYTWVDDPTGARQTRHVSIQRASNHQVMAYAQSSWCLLDPATGKPKRITEVIVNAFGLKEGK